MNSWAISGNLGRDAESRFTPSGDAVTSFSVAVKAGFGEKATTTWVNCTMWGKRGEAIAQYLKKGTLVGVVGEASLREWQDKEGQKRTVLEVRVNDLTLLGKQERQQDPQQERPQEQPPAKKPVPGFDDFADDVPF
jgi:single-strand DNA-binding protein